MSFLLKGEKDLSKFTLLVLESEEKVLDEYLIEINKIKEREKDNELEW